MFTKFLDPKNDFAFKRIFGSERNKDILIHFLNDMIPFKGGSPIQDVTFLKPVQDPETAAKKVSIVDILCKDHLGNTYVVEMQVAKEKGFEKRAQYYASKAYISQMHANGEYHDLKEVIFLAIVDFVMFPQKTDGKSDHVILDKKTLENDLKDFSFTFLELPKFKKDIHHLTDIVDKWAYFFKHAEETSEKEISQLAGKDAIIERAYDELNRFNWNAQELRTYDHAVKQEWDYNACMAQKFDEGMEKGIAKGIAEGMEKGIAEGMAKGAEKMAIDMLKEGMSDSMISKITKISLDDLCLLKIQSTTSTKDSN